MKYKYLPVVIGLAAILTCCFAISVSHAHRVIIFAWTEGKTVHTVSKFPGGRKVVDSPVVVYDGQGNRLLDGVTDEKGEFSFAIPKVSALNIIVEAGTGHQAEWTLSEKEVKAALGDEAEHLPSAAQTDKEKHTADESEKTTSHKTDDPESRDVVSGLTPDQVENIVEGAIDRKMAPVIRMLSDMHDPGPTIKDVFGGIGYILGLFGIAALVYTRKK